MTQMRLLPLDPSEDPLQCETCIRDVRWDGDLWYGSVEELDTDGTFAGYSYHCVGCINVLARMADALGALQGPDGNPLKLNDQGDVT